MAAPTATAIRSLLEGYGITAAVVSDAWIEARRDNMIIPHVENITRLTFDAEIEVTEWYNGNGQSTLILNRRPVNSIEEIIEVGALTEGNLAECVDLIGNEGIIKVKSNYSEGVYGPIFRKGTKNLKITYKYGYDDYPDDVAEAIMNLVAAKILAFLGARTGGGGLSVQAFGRTYGSHGKYTDIRKELVATGYALLKPYMTGVVGG
jgi:hypothetical protein